MNKEITIIDLLNKIANGEEVPKKIRYDGNDYYFCNPCRTYEVIESSELCGKDLYNLLDNLNDKVEIIEEDKKIEPYTSLSNIWSEQQQDELIDNFDRINTILNKLIDEVNKLKKDNKNV